MAWLLAKTKFNAFELARCNLARQGFEVFLPLERRNQRRRGKVVSLKTPYFGNYLFVSAASSTGQVSAIRSTLGVSCLVEFGGKAAEVCSQLVDDLRRNCDEEGCLTLPATVRKGDWVKVVSGPLFDRLGCVQELASKDRVWLLLEIMGRQSRTLVDRQDLVLA